MSLVDGSEISATKQFNPIARWGLYESWKITADQIHTFGDVSMSREWVKKEKDGKKVVKAHKGPVEFTFSFPLHKELFQSVDIAKEIQRWNGLVGKAASFYVGPTAFGAARKYRLVGVNVTEIESVRGIIVHCEVELSFEMVKKKVKQSEAKQFKKEISKKSKKQKKKQKKRRTG